jgi:hypothetical protein
MSSALAVLMAAAFCSSAVPSPAGRHFLRRGQPGEFALRGLGLFRQLRHLFRQSHGKMLKQRNYLKRVNSVVKNATSAPHGCDSRGRIAGRQIRAYLKITLTF